jgi:hypothetical protein
LSLVYMFSGNGVVGDLLIEHGSFLVGPTHHLNK